MDRGLGSHAGEGSTEHVTRDPGGRPRWLPWITPEWLEETGSTNADLLSRAKAGAPEGTVLLAERQTAGRGRLGRRWLDHPGGSVLCSMLFRPAEPIDRWNRAAIVVALAAVDACGEVAGVECTLKWPNDLLAPDCRKVGGILAEVGAGGALVVGIGLNCNWPTEFPPAGEPEAAEIAARAISLDRCRAAGAAGEATSAWSATGAAPATSARPVDRDAVARRLLEGVADRWPVVDAAALQAEYRSRCSTIGQLVRIELLDGELTGEALDVDDAGRLLVRTETGVERVDVGDVFHLRPEN